MTRRSRSPDGKWPPRDMPRARYAGSFDPAQIPGTTSAVRERSDIISYRAASRPKAAAFHPNGGRVFIVTGAVSQYAAEEQALRVCNTDRPSYGTSGPCFLYASGDAVVLPQRLIEPLAPAPVAPPLSNAPAEAPFDPEKIPYVKSRDDVRRYAAFKGAKNLAISTSGTSWWMPTQRQALEACEFSARHPCILYAVQDRVVAPDGLGKPRPALGPGEGRFDSAEVPFVPRPRARRCRSMPLRRTRRPWPYRRAVITDWPATPGRPEKRNAWPSNAAKRPKTTARRWPTGSPAMFMPSGTPSYWQDERPRQSLRSVSLNTATVLLHECGLRHLRSIETGLIIL